MVNYTVSILIVTKDRPLLLARCLRSLAEQVILPNQIVVINNGPEISTKGIITNFSQFLKITYVKERKIGEAFARNRALKLAKGEVLVFIDDDCVADKNWLKNILVHLQKYPHCDGLLGKTENLLKDNVFANVYQSYYLRWLMENFKDIDQIQFLTEESNFFDTKNVTFRKNLVKDFSFDPDVLFHSINVDNVAGSILSKKGKFFYNPRMVVFHQNWGSFRDLMIKNFFQGIADQWIFDKKNIETRKKLLNYSYLKWLKICRQEIKDLNFFKKILFWPLLFFYPIPYRLGRLVYKLGLFK